MKKNWFRKCDFLNVPTSLSYKNEYFYATNVGAALTLFFFVIIIAITTYEIILLYKKSSFTLISNQYTDLSEIIDFAQTPFLFQLINDRGREMNVDDKAFVMESYIMEQTFIQYENGTRVRRVNNIKIEMDICDKFYSNLSEFSGLNLSSYICMTPGQNLTAYGLLGDPNNVYRGIRVYINKCTGDNCYDDDTISKKLHNAKFKVSYLSLSSNIFYLNSPDIKYQLFTKFCSISTAILKKIVFTFDIGRFYLYNNVLFRNKIAFNYLLGNDYTLDVDLDSTSTLKKSDHTIAYISFHFGGNIIETRKEVQTLFESLSIIGNIFNIILTIFKVINNYYSNKILFVDIFSSIFFAKDNMNIINFNIKENSHFNYLNINKNNNSNKKRNMDLSDEFSLDNNKIKSIKSLGKKIMPITGNNSISKKKSENQGAFTKAKILYYYLLPLWVLRRNKTFNNIYLIKERICGYFSIEKINELIKFKEILEDKTMKSKMNNSELNKINNNNFENNDFDEIKNQTIFQNVKK